MMDSFGAPDFALDFIFRGSSGPASILLTAGLPSDWSSKLGAGGHLVEVTDETQINAWPARQFDWVVLCSALATTANLVDYLQKSSERLTPGGRLLVIAPNSRHFSKRLSALMGSQDISGSLFFPPSRSLDKNSLIEASQLAGLHVHKLQARRTESFAKPQSDLMSEACKSLLGKLNRDDTLDEACYVFELSCQAADPQAPSIRPGQRSLRVLALTDAVDSGIARIRLNLPLDAFAERGCRHVRYEAFGLVTEESLRWADVVVIQRGACGHALRAAEWCLSHGKPYIYEIDDLLIDLPAFMSHHVGYIKNKPLMEELIRGATAVTVTNENLKEALSHLNSEIWISPNFHIPRRRPLSPPKLQDDAPVHLLIAHTDKILLDFFVPVLQRVHNKWGPRIQIIAIGPIGDTIASAGIPCKQLPVIPLDEFIPTLASFPNPITMIPLDNSRFSSCKSAIKFFDYAQGGIVTICSNVSPYRDVVEHQRTGLLAENTVDHWLECLDLLIERPAERVRLAASAQKEVLTHHDLRHAALAWESVFGVVAPGDSPIRLPPKAPKRSSGLRRLRELLRAKNQQRKARRRLIKAALAAKAAETER